MESVGKSPAERVHVAVQKMFQSVEWADAVVRVGTGMTGGVGLDEEWDEKASAISKDFPVCQSIVCAQSEYFNTVFRGTESLRSSDRVVRLGKRQVPLATLKGCPLAFEKVLRWLHGKAIEDKIETLSPLPSHASSHSSSSSSSSSSASSIGSNSNASFTERTVWIDIAIWADFLRIPALQEEAIANVRAALVVENSRPAEQWRLMIETAMDCIELLRGRRQTDVSLRALGMQTLAMTTSLWAADSILACRAKRILDEEKILSLVSHRHFLHFRTCFYRWVVVNFPLLTLSIEANPAKSTPEMKEGKEEVKEEKMGQLDLINYPLLAFITPDKTSDECVGCYQPLNRPCGKCETNVMPDCRIMLGHCSHLAHVHCLRPTTTSAWRSPSSLACPGHTHDFVPHIQFPIHL